MDCSVVVECEICIVKLISASISIMLAEVAWPFCKAGFDLVLLRKEIWAVQG